MPCQGHNNPIPLKRSPPGSFKRLLGDTRSRTSPPTARHPYTYEQADTGEPTGQNRCYGGVEIRHRKGSGDRESDNSANERATAILGRKPLQLGKDDNRSPDSEHASDARSGKESGLPCCAAKDGTDHGTEACQDPGGEEYRYGLHGNRLVLDPASQTFQPVRRCIVEPKRRR